MPKKAIQKIIRKICRRDIRAITEHELKNDEGITSRISFGGQGICRCDVSYSDGGAEVFTCKRKSRSIIIKGLRILSGKQPGLTLRLAANHKVLGFNGSHLRETRVYENLDPSLKSYLIPALGHYHNRFTDTHVLLLKYVDAPEKITAKDYKLAFDAITDFHAAYYCQPEKADALGANRYGASDYRRCKAALVQMFLRLDADNQAVLGQSKTDKIIGFLQNIDREFIPYHRTLTHNDFSPRNTFRADNRLYIYDWELACYQNPEHDLIEFLVSVMHEASDDEIKEMIAYFRQVLSEKIGKQTDEDRYMQILRFNALEFAGNRLTLLRLADLQFGLPYVGQMTLGVSRLMDLLGI